MASWIDNVIRVCTVILNSVPHWWLGLMILVISANTIRIFPLGGMSTQGNDTLLRIKPLAPGAARHRSAAMGGWIGYSRYMRSEVLDGAAARISCGPPVPRGCASASS